MNDDDDDHSFRYYWEKYCPCRLHRKNIVLITLTILCFALVTWTVAATINPPNQKNASNVTYVVIDDSKPLKQINITLNSALVMASAIKKAKAIPTPKPSQSFLRQIMHPVTQEPMCKCMCAEVSEREMLDALFTQEEERERLNVTTTERPKTGLEKYFGMGKGKGRGGGDDSEYDMIPEEEDDLLDV